MAMGAWQAQADVTAAVTAPADCALLLALPLTRASFAGDVEGFGATDPGCARGDYAHRMVAQAYNGDVDRAWEHDGKEVAALGQALVDEARAARFVLVDAAATSASLAAAAASGASVIMLCAHWRGPEVARVDLRPPFEDAVADLATSPDPFLRDLARHFAAAEARYLDAARESVRVEGVNAFLRSRAFGDPEAMRDQLDDWFCSALVAGNCLELRDGFFKALDLAAVIPADWAGIFDLGICHSLRLALALKAGRSDRLVVTNEAEKQPDRCFRELREVAVRLSAQAQPYLPLRRDVFVAYSVLTGS